MDSLRVMMRTHFLRYLLLFRAHVLGFQRTLRVSQQQVHNPDTALPYSGSPRVGFAGLMGTMPVLRRPYAFPLRFVASAPRYHRSLIFFVPPDVLLRDAITIGLDVYGFSADGHPIPIAPDGTVRASQVPGESSRAFAPLIDPGRASLPCHCSSSVLPPQRGPRRPQRYRFRG